MSDAPLIVGHARKVLGRSDTAIAGLWQRTVALLARQALETAVAAALAARAPGTDRCSATAQLLCLPTYTSTDAALEAGYLWAVLSRACHHHSYELAPTWDELAHWLERVEAVSATLSPPPTG